jgi:hypothetical protein
MKYERKPYTTSLLRLSVPNAIDTYPTLVRSAISSRERECTVHTETRNSTTVVLLCVTQSYDLQEKVNCLNINVL